MQNNAANKGTNIRAAAAATRNCCAYRQEAARVPFPFAAQRRLVQRISHTFLRASQERVFHGV